MGFAVPADDGCPVSALRAVGARGESSLELPVSGDELDRYSFYPLTSSAHEPSHLLPLGGGAVLSCPHLA